MREIKWKGILYDKRFLVIGLLICVVALSGCESPPIKVHKEVNPSFATLGTNLTYNYTVTNVGNNDTDTIENITIVDDLLGNIPVPGTLNYGDSANVTMLHTVNETDLNNVVSGLFIVNNAYANATLIYGPDRNETPTTSNSTFAAVATPFRFIQNVASDNVVKIGDDLDYEITVCNPLDIPDGEADNVIVTEVFDHPVHFVHSNLPILPTYMQNDKQYTWVIDRIAPKECATISLVIMPEENETPYTLNSCASITSAGNETIDNLFDNLSQFVPDIEELLPYFHDCTSITVVSKEYSSLDSFEELLRDQHKLLVSFDELMGQTPETRDQKIVFLNSIEDLYRRQALGMDKFSDWIDVNWEKLTPVERAQISDSLEDLIRSQSKDIEAFNGNLLAWVKTFDQPYRQKFSDSLEDLLHRQVALLVKFDRLMQQDGMPTPGFVRSFEDLLRRQAQSLQGFGDLGEFTFDNTTQEGPGIAIYKTADKTSLACGDDVTYKYTVYNNGDEDLSDIQVQDSNYGLVGTIPSLGVYQSKSIEKTVTTECSPNETYPIKVCNTAIATGKASSGDSTTTVEAKSNELCIILNGPRQSGPDFTLEKTVEPTYAIQGDQLNYTYTITDNGLLPITDINIVDDKLGEITTGQELQPGAFATYTKDAVMGDSDITNIATATGIEGEGDVQSPGPRSQIVEATATATVKFCENPVGPLEGFLIQEPTTTGECGYIFETLDGTKKYQLIPEEGYEDEFWQIISDGCLFNVSGCLLDIQTSCPITQEIIVSNIEPVDIQCSDSNPLEGLNGIIKSDGTGNYSLEVSTTPSGVVFDVKLYNDSTPPSIWQQITDNLGMSAHVVGCTNNTDNFPNGQGLIVQCVKILDGPKCKCDINGKCQIGTRVTGVLEEVNTGDDGNCYYLDVGDLKVGLDNSTQSSWDKLPSYLGKTVTITGCRDNNTWSCSDSGITTDFRVLVETVRPFDPPSESEKQNGSCKTCGKS
jgi:hypothetical protein